MLYCSKHINASTWSPDVFQSHICIPITDVSSMLGSWVVVVIQCMYRTVASERICPLDPPASSRVVNASFLAETSDTSQPRLQKGVALSYDLLLPWCCAALAST